jgi:hypothetical protein
MTAILEVIKITKKIKLYGDMDRDKKRERKV